MERKKDGSYVCSREELLNDKFKVLSIIYPLSEHQFHVLIKDGDSLVDNIANKVFFVALGVFLQIIVILGFVCYYQLSHNKGMVDSTLSRFDKFEIGLLLVCLIFSGVLKLTAMCRKSEKKQLISSMKSHFNKKDNNGL